MCTQRDSNPHQPVRTALAGRAEPESAILSPSELRSAGRALNYKNFVYPEGFEPTSAEPESAILSIELWVQSVKKKDYL